MNYISNNTLNKYIPSVIRKTFKFLDPIANLGQKEYLIGFSMIISVFICVLSEIYAYLIVKDPLAVGKYLIFVNIIEVIYFSFRGGIYSGLTSVFVIIVYYFYIIFTRNFTGAELANGLNTTFFLTLVYTSLATVIGYLKQQIDSLLAKEISEKIWLQSIIYQIPVGIIITDDKGEVIEQNRQITKILEKKNFIGKHIGRDEVIDIYDTEGKKVHPTQLPLAHSLAKGVPVDKKDFVIYGKKGKKKYIQISSRLVKNRFDKVVAGIVLVNDETLAREHERRKDDFVNMASHELKTPLTSIKLYAELLKKDFEKRDPKKSIKILDQIDRQLSRLQDIVFNLLDVSRLQTGKLTIEKNNFDLIRLIKECILDLDKTTKPHKIRYVSKLSTLKINADRLRIYQVITNLLNNAIKYSPDGGNIDVEAKTEENNALISVKDHGIGIAQDQIKLIFNRLYQVPGHLEQTFPGFGMGLYIAKEIIKKHNGRIWVKSSKGKGSTFYITIPL